MREYSKVDMVRFLRFSKENQGLKPIELIKMYDIAFPELTSKEKLINLARGLKINNLHRAITGKDLPIENECNCTVDVICNHCMDNSQGLTDNQ